MNNPLTITRENGMTEKIGHPLTKWQRFSKWFLNAFAGLFMVGATLFALPAGAQSFNNGGVTSVKAPTGIVYTSSATTAFAGATTEALLSFSDCRNNVCAAAATTHTVTSTATLRLDELCVTWQNQTAAAGGVTIRCRINPSAAVVSTSTVFATLNASTALTTTGSGATSCVSIPSGISLRRPMQWGCSQFAVTTSSGFFFNVFGVEY